MQRKRYDLSAKNILLLIITVMIIAVIVIILCKTGLSVDVSNNVDKLPETNMFTDTANDTKADTDTITDDETVITEPSVELITHNSNNNNLPVNDSIPMSTILPAMPESAIDKYGLFDTVTFAAAGDILIHTNVYKYAAQLASNKSAEYDFKPIFKNIKEIISSADIAYVNQETPSAGKDRVHSGYPRFNTPDEIADAVIDCGFDIVNVANNHMLDMGASGLERNINFWSSKGITLIGGFKNKQDYNNIRVIEKNNISIALLSYTYGTNGLVLPASSELYIPYEDYDEINRQTKIAREMADVVIVSMHWGHEDHFNPSDNQKKLARMMADNGVDVVLGMHPHVLQPIEWLERPDGGRTLVIYSLGNLISTMMYSRNMLGGIATFTIVKSPSGITIEMPELIPTMTYYQSGFASPTIYLYKNFDDTMLSRHGASKYDSLISRKYLNNIITGCIDRQFITDEFYDSIYGE